MSNARDSLDFSKPWQFSDSVLAVEGDRFHVHRNILGMWSPVFTMMFAAGTANPFPLPGKKSAEIKEMLLVIYPTSGKPIDQTNYAFLLDLATEYKMMKLTEKCENYLILRLEKENTQFQLPRQNPFALPKGLEKGASQFLLQFHPFVPDEDFIDKCFELLNIGQNYRLDRLQSACIELAMRFKFQKLTTDSNYKNISVSNRERIFEGMVRRTEEELKTKEQLIKSKDDRDSRAKEKAVAAIKELENIIYIVFVVCKANYLPATIHEKLNCISRSNGELRKLAGPLKDLHDKLTGLCYDFGANPHFSW